MDNTTTPRPVTVEGAHWIADQVHFSDDGPIEALHAAIDDLQLEAYAEGRKDQSEEGLELLRWAYSKLHHINFTKQDDALMLDRINLLLQHGISA